MICRWLANDEKEVGRWGAIRVGLKNKTQKVCFLVEMEFM
jgi:hypothetical protein